MSVFDLEFLFPTIIVTMIPAKALILIYFLLPSGGNIESDWDSHLVHIETKEKPSDEHSDRKHSSA
jgi:hypothetical protein